MSPALIRLRYTSMINRSSTPLAEAERLLRERDEQIAVARMYADADGATDADKDNAARAIALLERTP